MTDSDGESERAQPAAVGPERRVKKAPAHFARRRRYALIGLIAVVALAVFLGPKLFGGPKAPADYTGEGKKDIVVEVQPVLPPVWEAPLPSSWRS